MNAFNLISGVGCASGLCSSLKCLIADVVVHFIHSATSRRCFSTQVRLDKTGIIQG